MEFEFKSMTVFCGASKGINPDLFPAAFRLGEIIGDEKMKLIFGIGDNGMMGQVFRGALSKNAAIEGITTKELLELQCEDPTLFKPGEIMIVPDLFVRKFMMFKDGDIITVLPGGWGTIDEFAEFSVTIQTRQIMKKPLIFVNLNGFWDPLKEMLTVMYKNGCVNKDRLDYVGFVDSVEDVIPKAQEIMSEIGDKEIEKIKAEIERIKNKNREVQ
ncbi:MAG: TIGR00730 family Rossman fold protein [Alphaproteobacteria bacterium]|nr:TIGR00730 family Rossman fold protein [Alphaproteobacteria bacterium]